MHGAQGDPATGNVSPSKHIHRTHFQNTMSDESDNIIRRFNDRIKLHQPRPGTGKAAEARITRDIQKANARKAIACWLVDQLSDEDNMLVVDVSQLAIYGEADLKISGIYDQEKNEGGYRIELVFNDKNQNNSNQQTTQE